jgi:hypothetical protein
MIGHRSERRTFGLASPAGHEQAHVVATRPSRLGRLLGSMIGVDREAQREWFHETIAFAIEDGDRAHLPTSLAT